MKFKNIFNSVLRDMLSISGFQVLLGLSQIFLTPLFIQNWGSNYYGEYLLIFSLANFFSASDFGIGSTAINEISRLRNANSIKRSKIVQDITFMAMSLVSLFFLFLTYFLIIVLYKYDFIKVNLLQHDFNKILAYSFLIIWLNVGLLSLPMGMYKSIDKYYLERVSSSIFKFLEISVTIVILKMHESAITLVKMLFILKILNFIFLIFDLKYRGVDLRIKYKMRLNIIKSLINPSISSIKIMYTQSFYIQGVNVLVGKFLGPEKLVIFNVYRVILNGGKQISNIVNLALWPKITAEYGRKNWSQINKFIKFGIQLGLFISVIYILSGLTMHNIILPKLIHSDSSQLSIFSIYILCLLPYSLYSTKLAYFGATNSFSVISNGMFILSALNLMLLYILFQINNNINLLAVGVLLLIYEIFSVLYVNFEFKKFNIFQ